MNHFIDVILAIPLENMFTYSITQAESQFLKVGMRVSVPFGKTKIHTGLVGAIHTNAPQIYEAKEIHQILDSKPIVTKIQLEFWQWISKYYLCTVGEVMRAALPNAFILESETLISRNLKNDIKATDLKDDEYIVFDALHHQSTLKIQEISKILDKKNVLPVIKRLIEKEVIVLQEEIYDKYKPKYVRYVKLQAEYTSEVGLHQLLDELSRAQKQRQVVMTLFSLSARSNKPMRVKALIEESGSSSRETAETIR